MNFLVALAIFAYGVSAAQLILPVALPTEYLNLTALTLSLFSKYDALARPLAGTPNQTMIQCQYRLNKLQNLDPVSGTFSMDLFLRLTWRDPRLVIDTSILQGEDLRVDPKYVWKPDIYFYNEAQPMAAQDSVLKLKPDGTLFWSRHFSMVMNADFNMRDFPFDTQKLSFQLISYSYKLVAFHFLNLL
ncbi:UNVERIFIED_CONTAM: Gamma-aminobutyric acid receptor subunit rho-1 [Siphonaria sp. JEL0065]|nr:Gamma-aminobutyric acid receptor subunit rho-1 [Siphonaria sp. JEL0065]